MSTKPLHYEIQVIGRQRPIVYKDSVPASLTVAAPPKDKTLAFLALLIKKYHDEIMKSQAWKCWKCGKKATSMLHTPMSYLHLKEPMVRDIAQPICCNGGVCDKEGRLMIEEEMREANGMGPAGL